jgi:geranylgeranyl pyrophosphate synthase
MTVAQSHRPASPATEPWRPAYPAEVKRGLRRVARDIHVLSMLSWFPELDENVAQLVERGGKRLRAALCLTTALALSGRIDATAVRSAACVELVHAGSLVHDDLMDHADRRRGVQTLHTRWGASTAMLVGDVILARAAQAALARVSPETATDLMTSAVALAEGQYRELRTTHDLDRTAGDALRSVELKTGALFRVACAAGARAAGADETAVTALARYGDAFGVVFQLLDDLLDLVGEPEPIGKPVGTDLLAGVYTVPLLRLFAREPGHPVRDLLVHKGRDLTATDVVAIRESLRDTDIVTDTLTLCRSWLTEAVARLPAGGHDGAAAALRELPFGYLARVAGTVGAPDQGSFSMTRLP